ncbi:MAG: hypothetical protein M3R69_02445 [Acidobacteriota bacterium]|nr:hypothetical protein [Acidobacteriota bacterium]
MLLVMACLTPWVSHAFAKAVSPAEAAKSLPDRIGTFRAQGPASIPPLGFEENNTEAAVISNAARSYSTASGNTFLVYVTKTRMDSAAYSLLTRVRHFNQEIKVGDVGTASIVGPRWVFFFKGNSFVKILQLENKVLDAGETISLARGLSEQLEGGENDLPVLVKHLPDWQKVQPQAPYAVSLEGLKELLPNQPVLDSVSFEGGAEAVVANYDSGKLVIIEFNTARIAGDNDWNIRTKINELRSANQPVGTATPSAYRRVGNYSVFVFDAPSEQAANQLIDQVKYQKVVQWLGENPYLYENAQREFVETTLGVFVAVVKGSGLALVACFGIGGFFGALLFVRRRSQQRAVEAYSDAGGMVRLNLDEITPQADPGRLLGGGN